MAIRAPLHSGIQCPCFPHSPLQASPLPSPVSRAPSPSARTLCSHAPLVLHRRTRRWRCEASGREVGFFERLGRVIKEKAKSDVDRLFSGFSKTRENLAVVDELLTYWNLADSEQVLDELEEVRASSFYKPPYLVLCFMSHNLRGRLYWSIRPWLR